MPELLPGAVFIGILTVATVALLRLRALKPRLPLWRLALIGVAAAYLLPPSLAVLRDLWDSTPGLPDLPVVTSGQLFLGLWTTGVALTVTQRPGQPPRLPLWAGLLMGLAVAALLPPLLDRTTGRYQPASLRADLTHCAPAMLGQVQPREAVNICDEPITVGLCLPGEMNPAPCAQSVTLQPGERATFDPGAARLSSLPSNPDGLTVVACRPPARPSRDLGTGGRGRDGVCLPPG